MNNSMLNKLLFLLVTALMCLVLAGAASAVTNSDPAYPNAVETDNSAIDGHKMVYEYKCSDTDHDIYIRDLTTTTSTPVTTSLRDDRNPDISGNIVVWQSKATGGHWQIYWKDTSTNKPEALVHTSSYDQINPSISGDFVVWEEYWSAADANTGGGLDNYDIKGYDLIDSAPCVIASTAQFEGYPDISGSTVVYEKYENLGSTNSPNWQMQVYKTTFGTSNKGTKIHPRDESQYTPVISGKKILWTENNDDTSSSDIWCQNLDTGNGFWVTQTTGDENLLAIAGNIAVWNKWNMPYGDGDILMQDVSSSSNPKKSIAKGISDQWNPAVGVDQYGIFASFTDHKDGTDRVYWRNMDSTVPKPTAGSPARNAVNVPVNKVITTTFSEPIKLGAGTIKLVSSSGTGIDIFISVNGKVLTVAPMAGIILNKATKYTLVLAAGSVTDYAGNHIAAYSRSFTTDSTPPTAIAGSPARNAVNVDITKVITTTFNEPIYATANMWITLKTVGGTPVTINPVIIDNVLYIYHALLAPSTKYLLELHTGCISDLAGNLLKYYYRYFTTAAT